ncbi:MAG: phosphatidate cytidylyltransferase [Bacteroidia bacterium]
MDKNLIQRLITGTFFVLALVGAMLWNEWSFGILFLTVVVLGLWEFYGLVEKTGASPQRITGVFLGTVLFCCGFLFKTSSAIIFLPFIALLFLPFFFELFRKKEHPFANIGYTLLGVIYVALPFSLWAMIVVPDIDVVEGEFALPFHGKTMLGYFILLWTSDSMAYVCGRLLGKRKLFERISPKKTWEGFIGGMLFTFLAAWLVATFLTHDDNLIFWMIVAVIVAITGTLGDLVESMFKRSIGVKDSGTILPGHGGILDRFDAVLLSSPFVAVMLIFIQTILEALGRALN